MRWTHSLSLVATVASLVFEPGIARAQVQEPRPQGAPAKFEVLTDAAVVAAIITASIAAYKAMGRPCACPEDTMRNGRRVQMQLNPQQPDPVQQKIFSWMPVIFTFMLASFPSRLVIYWAWNNVLSLIQQYAIMRRICGGNSAWSRPGGFKPLCYASDITPTMSNAYRATGAIPPLR